MNVAPRRGHRELFGQHGMGASEDPVVGRHGGATMASRYAVFLFFVKCLTTTRKTTTSTTNNNNGHNDSGYGNQQ
jgi:hypothetical protein